MTPTTLPRMADLSLALALPLLIQACADPTRETPDEDRGTEEEEAGRRPNLLVITLDTTRADHLGCYGHDGIRTPNIDSLAEEGVLFEEAFSVQPVTLPSHSSIFTGLYPYNHGVRDNNIYKLADEVDTLAEVLSREGYLTTAFVSSYILNRQFGLHQGFRYYNDRFVKPKQKGRLPVDRRASEVSFLARDWLERVEDEIAKAPFFLWLHYYDPHADYNPPHPYKTAYASQYDGEIAYTDDWLGYFFAELEKRGLWDDTIVVLLADHGESLGQYGEKTHGMFIYRPTTHVPLIVRYPDKIPAGTRVKERVSTVDVVPMVLDLLGLKPPGELDGISLVPLIGGGDYPEKRDIYSEVFIPRTFNWSELKGIRSSDRFYIAAPRPELYALEPGKPESGDLTAEEPKIAARMATRLEKTLAASKPVEGEEVTVTAEMVDRLEALGYFMGGGAAPDETPSDGGLPDPKDRIGLFNLSQRVNGLLSSGRTDEAIELLELMVEKDEGNPRFLMELGDAMCSAGRHGDGVGMFDRAIAMNPRDARLFFLQGQCYADWGKKERAQKALEEAVRLSPKHFLALFHLGLIRIELEQWEAARAAFEKALETHPNDPGLLNNLGFILIKGMGDTAAGIEMIERAARLAPDNPFVLGSLGSAYREAGDLEKAVSNLEAAVKLIPDHEEFIKQLKEIYEEMGNTRGAEAMGRRLELIRSH